MYRLDDERCRKCGGHTSVRWVEPERSSGMDIEPLKSGGMKRDCHRCGYSEYTDSLDQLQAKELALEELNGRKVGLTGKGRDKEDE